MKLIALGDIHGRNIWKQILAKEDNFDKIVFIGDYFDSKDGISVLQEIENFKEILELKKKFKDKVVLLFGNHDFHYLNSINENYSGYNHTFQVNISEVLHEAIDEGLIQMCFVMGNLIFSHAGITKTWCKNNDVVLKDIQDSINKLFIYNPKVFAFVEHDNADRAGDDIFQSPIWVRPKSLLMDRIDNFTQVVGHTQVRHLILRDDVIFIDTLGTTREYFCLEDGVIESRSFLEL